MSSIKDLKNMGDMKVDLESADEMTEDQRREVYESEPSISNIPDLDKLTKDIYNVLEFLEKPEIGRQLRKNKDSVMMYINKKFVSTAVSYNMIKILLDEDTRIENTEMLLNMLDKLALAKKGEIDLKDAEKDVSEKVNSKYIYSQFGSKENFEKELKKELAKGKDIPSNLTKNL
jgi:hypothetical protein